MEGTFAHWAARAGPPQRTAYAVLVTTTIAAAASWWVDWTGGGSLVTLVFMLLAVKPLRLLAGD